MGWVTFEAKPNPYPYQRIINPTHTHYPWVNHGLPMNFRMVEVDREASIILSESEEEVGSVADNKWAKHGYQVKLTVEKGILKGKLVNHFECKHCDAEPFQGRVRTLHAT